MPRFQFSLSTTDIVREAGVVQSESFADALAAIEEHVSAKEGDKLEIGVSGFPPARYEFVGGTMMGGTAAWRPAGLLAA
jgi:hypothetical protein